MAKHKTFFGKIFGGFWDTVKSVFKKADHTLLEIAIKVTNTVKDALNSGFVDIITKLIPGDIDNKFVDLLKLEVPKILAAELLLKALPEATTETDAQAIGKQLLDAFGGLSDTDKEEFYTSVAAKIFIFINAHKNGEKVTFGQAAQLVEGAYQEWLVLQSKENDGN